MDQWERARQINDVRARQARMEAAWWFPAFAVYMAALALITIHFQLNEWVVLPAIIIAGIAATATVHVPSSRYGIRRVDAIWAQYSASQKSSQE